MTPDLLITPLSIHWVQDSAQVLVVDERAGQTVRLTGLDASVWKWFSLGYGYADVLTFVQASLRQPPTDAKPALDLIINHWIELGLLATEGAE